MNVQTEKIICSVNYIVSSKVNVDPFSSIQCIFDNFVIQLSVLLIRSRIFDAKELILDICARSLSF